MTFAICCGFSVLIGVPVFVMLWIMHRDQMKFLDRMEKLAQQWDRKPNASENNEETEPSDDWDDYEECEEYWDDEDLDEDWDDEDLDEDWDEDWGDEDDDIEDDEK